MCACHLMHEVSAQESSPSLYPLDNSSDVRYIEACVHVDETFVDEDTNVINVDIVCLRIGFKS
jgi:hypothetical protein